MMKLQHGTSEEDFETDNTNFGYTKQLRGFIIQMYLTYNCVPNHV